MLHNLKIFVDKHTSGISVHLFRGYILSIINNLPQEDQDKICFHLTKEELLSPTHRKIPYVLFGKPHRDCFTLYGYEDEGKRLLNLIKRELRFSISLKGKQFNVKNVLLKSTENMPKKSETGEDILYKTKTPILLFNGNRRRIYNGIVYGNKDLKVRDEKFKEAINSMLRANIKNLMRTTYKNKKYDIFNNIKIDWIDFKVVMVRDRDQKQPVIFGTFKTDWHLPEFIGSRTGAGFGQINQQRGTK